MKNMRDKRNYNLISIFLIVILFEPPLFVKYQYLNFTYIIGACISCLCAIFHVLKYKKISKITFELIILMLIYLVNTLLHGGDILKIGYQSIVLVSLFLHAEHYYKNNKMNEFINIITNMCRTYLFINLISYIIWEDGLYAAEKYIYFLGYRTRFTEYAFLTLALSFLEFYRTKNAKTLMFSLIIVIFNIILPKVSTAIVGIIVVIMIFIFIKYLPKFRYRNLIYFALLANILIIFFRIQENFSFFIETILHKNVDLTYRTVIWDNSYKYIFDKYLLIGHGYFDNGNFILWANQLWQAHSQILQLLYEVGIIGSIIFYHICFLSIKTLREKNNTNIMMISVLIAFLIMMTVEIYGYYIPFYTLLIIMYYLNFSENKEKK